MDKQSWLCSICGAVQATSFCTCSGKRETFLCEGCILPHYKKNPGRLHLCIPVSAYGMHTVPGYFDRLNMRGAQIPLGRDELLANLEAVDACIAEFNFKIEAAISTMRNYAQTTLARLQQVRADLERDIHAAIEEVERTMYLDCPILEKKCANELRDFGQGGQSLKIFKYKMTECLPKVTLEKMLQFHIIDIFPSLQILLPGIYKNSLRVYDLKTGETKQASLSRSFSDGTVYCVVDNTEVLCIGGNPAAAQICSLSLSDYQIREMKPMSTARSWPGVFMYGRFVYIFGGYTGRADLSSCEKYTLERRSWSILPTMLNPRRAFTPCLFEKELYLGGAFPSHRILETFSLVTEQFKALSIQLPRTGQDANCFISGRELIIITPQYDIWKWQINSTETSFRESKAVDSGPFSVSSCPVCKIGSDIYWVQCINGDLITFSMDTNTIRRAR